MQFRQVIIVWSLVASAIYTHGKYSGGNEDSAPSGDGSSSGEGSGSGGRIASESDQQLRMMLDLEIAVPWKDVANISRKDCKDLSDDCGEASEKYCLENFKKMGKKCAWSCRFCAQEGGDIEDCEDQDETKCPGNLSNDKMACQRLPDYMLQNCKKSCNFCGTESDKTDKHAVCPLWAGNGYCKTNDDIELNCPHSCKKFSGVQAPSVKYPYPVIALSPYQFQPGQYPIPQNPSLAAAPQALPPSNPYPAVYPYPSSSPSPATHTIHDSPPEVSAPAPTGDKSHGQHHDEEQKEKPHERKNE